MNKWIKNIKPFISKALVATMLVSTGLNSIGTMNVLAHEVNKEVTSIENFESEISTTTGSAIKLMKDTRTIEEKIEEGILCAQAFFEEYMDNNFRTFDYKVSMGLRRSGFDVEKINQKKNIYGMSDIGRDAKNTITLIATGNNPRNYEGKSYLESITDNKFLESSDCEEIALSILSLNMAEEEYDRELVMKTLIAKGVEENGLLKFGEISEEYDDWTGECTEEFLESTETTALVLTVFSMHRDIEGVEDAIYKAKEYLKSEQEENGLIKSVTSWSENVSVTPTAYTIQAIIALGEDPYGEEWTKTNSIGEKVNLVDGLLSCKSEKGFSNEPGSSWPSEAANAEALMALTDLRENNSVYNELRVVKVSLPSRIEIQEEEEVNLVEGDSKDVEVKVYDNNNLLVEGEEIEWISDREDVAIFDNGKIKALKGGQATLTVRLKNNNKICDTLVVNVEKNTGLPKDIEEKVKNEIEFLKEHYKVYNNYEFLAAPAANVCGMDKEHIRNNLHTYSRYNSTVLCSKSIIGLAGGESNPKAHEVNGEFRNYVDVLRASQVKGGKYKGQFILNEGMDGDALEYQAYSIIALNMVNEKFHEKEAVDALVKLINSEDYKKVASYKEIKAEAVALTALSKYNHIEGVSEAIEKLIEFLKSEQNEDGGFNLGDGYFTNSPITTGTVVQGLIANGINPLVSTEWIKNGKTMLDSLLMSKYEIKDHMKNAGYSKGDAKSGMDYQSTYHAFAALVDLYTNESMFTKLKASYNDNAKGEVCQVKIQNIKDKVLLAGTTINLNAVAFDEKENWIEDAQLTWKSSNDKVVSVDKGLIKAISSGTATITAKAEGKDISDSIDITVEGNDVKSLEIVTSSNTIKKGEKLKLACKAKDAKGDVIENQAIEWLSNNNEVATINKDTGEVIALSSGTVIIKAMLKDNKEIKTEIELSVVEDKNANIKVRVEGLNKTLHNETIEYGFNLKTTPLDVLKKTIGEENIEGDDGDWGYFIKGILGERQTKNTGWSYYVKFKDTNNIVQPMKSVDKFDGMTNLKGECIVDELVFYMTAYSGITIYTKIPVVTIENEGNKYTVKVVENSAGNKAIRDVDIKVGEDIQGKTDENGEFKFVLEKAGVYNINVSKDKDYPYIVRQEFTVENEAPEKNYNIIINNTIDGLRDYLMSMEKRMDSKFKEHPAFYRSLEALALNCTSEYIGTDIEDIAKKVKINEAEATLPYANNIIALKSAGINQDKYIKGLVEAQKEDGSFKLGRVEQTEWAVIALDMVKADYNKEKAAKYIMEDNKKEDDISLISVALIALSNHKDIEGVEDFINSKLEFIKSKQLDTAGFTMSNMSGEEVESSLPISYVISALVANGINPLTDKEWIKGENTLLDALLKFKKLNYFVYETGPYGEYMYKDEATEQAFIALVDLKNNKSTFTNVQEAVSCKGIIDNSLMKLRDYLIKTEKRTNSSLEEVDIFYSYMEALAINATSNNLSSDYHNISKKIKLNEKDDVLSIAENIMALTAAGINPEKHNSINYLDKLVAMQNDNGEFVEKGKEINIYKQAYSIIALDLANKEYNVEKAIRKLISMSKDGVYDDVDEIAWALIALSKHKDVEGCSELISSCIKYLKDNQSDNGGYDPYGMGEDITSSTAMVIQALMANDIDPLSKEWIKSKGNLVSSLISNQLEDGTFRMCQSMGECVELDSTQKAFAALADLYNKKSIYSTVEAVLDNEDLAQKYIRDVKKYFHKDEKYNYIQSMSLIVSGEKLETVKNKFELREEEANRWSHIVLDNDKLSIARNIMGIIAIGENPRDCNGKNYVEILENLQDESGKFSVSSPETNANCIIALDMAKSNYDAEKAVEYLIDKYNSLKAPSIFNTVYTMIALQNHRDSEGANETIKNCIDNIKFMQNQLDTGGVSYKKSKFNIDGEVAIYDALAIQGLIAVGEDPLSHEYTKNGKNLLDALLQFKRDEFFVYDEYKGEGYPGYIDEATGHAFAALIDLMNKKSIYHSFTVKVEEDKIKPEIITDLKDATVKQDELQFNAYANDNKDGKISVIVKLNDSIVNGMNDTYKVKLTKGENKVAITARDKQGNESIKSFTIIYEYIESNVELRKRVQNSIEEASNLLVNEAKVDAWSALGIARADKIVPDKYINSIDISKFEFATDYEKTIIGLLSVGSDPCNFKGVNLVNKLCEFDLTEDTINAIAYGLIALDAGEYKISGKCKWTREVLINKILEYQNEDGGWSLFEGPSEPDMTGIVMTALAPYNNNENKEVQEAINKAVKALQSMQVSEGEHKGAFEIKGEYATPANSNSTAQVIVGLSSNGIDPTSEMFTKDGYNPVNALLTFKSENGGFGFTDCKYNKIGTKQSLYALEQYIYLLDGKGSIFAWGDKNPIKNKEIIIEKGTDVKEFKCGDDAKITMNITNNKEESQKVTLVIALYNKEGKFITYVAAEQIIDKGMKSNLTAMMKLPNSGEYTIKYFVWDDFKNMSGLSEVIEIPVK